MPLMTSVASSWAWAMVVFGIKLIKTGYNKQIKMSFIDYRWNWWILMADQVNIEAETKLCCEKNLGSWNFSDMYLVVTTKISCFRRWHGSTDTSLSLGDKDVSVKTKTRHWFRGYIQLEARLRTISISTLQASIHNILLIPIQAYI